MGSCADETAMIEDLLELRCGFRVPVHGNQSLAAHARRVQPAEPKTLTVETIHRQLIRKSDSQLRQAVCRLASSQGG